MFHYMADIMSDASGFSWQNAKAANVVLLCDMGRMAVNWQETAKIDRIKRVHAQKRTQNSKPWIKNNDSSQKLLTSAGPWAVLLTRALTSSLIWELNMPWYYLLYITLLNN